MPSSPVARPTYAGWRCRDKAIGGLVAVAVFAVVYTDGDVAIALQLAGWSAIMLVGGAAFRLRAGAAR